MTEPDRRMYRRDVADYLGIRVRSMGRLHLPPRDGTEIIDGHASPWWWASVIEEWAPNRPKPGRPPAIRDAQ